MVEPLLRPRISSAGPVGLGFSHAVTTIVLIALPGGTVSCSWAVSGAPAPDTLSLLLDELLLDELLLLLLEELLLDELLLDELLAIGGGSNGIGVPGKATKAAAGNGLVPVAPAWVALHFGIVTTRVPCPCGSCRTTAPGVVSPTAGSADTVALVPHGGMITVRDVSAVGTITARIPGSTGLGVPLLWLLLALIAVPTTRSTINPTIVPQTMRLLPRLSCEPTDSPVSVLSSVSAIGCSRADAYRCAGRCMPV